MVNLYCQRGMNYSAPLPQNQAEKEINGANDCCEQQEWAVTSTDQGSLFVGLGFSLAGISHAALSSVCPAHSYGQLRERQLGVSLPNGRKRSQSGCCACGQSDSRQQQLITMACYLLKPIGGRGWQLHFRY